VKRGSKEPPEICKKEFRRNLKRRHKKETNGRKEVRSRSESKKFIVTDS